MSPPEAGGPPLPGGDGAFRLLFEKAAAGLAFVSAEGAFLRVNPALCRLLGYPQEELLGRRFQELTHPDDLAESLRVRDRLAAGGPKGASFEKRYLRKDGRVVWARVVTAPFSDGEGRLLGFVTQVEDISDRKQAEEELRRGEERFRFIFENAAAGVAVFAGDGRILQINETACRFLGRTRDELIGLDKELLTHPEDRGRSREALERAKRLGSGAYALEKRYLRKDGSVLWAYVVVRWLRGPEGPVGVAFVLDITRRKELESALREEKERYRSLFEDNPTMYFGVAADGTVLEVNRFGAEQLGYTVEELTGRSVLEVFHPEDREAVLAQVRACLARPGEPRGWELRKVRKDGSVLWVKELARVVEGRDGRPCVLVVCEDITDRRRTEESLRQKGEMLRQSQKLEAVGSLIASVAHDLNNPLGTVVGYANLLKDRPECRRVRSELREIHENAQLCRRIMDRLLLFVRRGKPKVESVSLRGAAVRALGLLGHRLREAGGVRAELRIPAALRVRADPSRLVQVLVNLVLNACDAMEGQPGPRLLVLSARREGPQAVLDIEDTGPGVPAPLRERVFEPFFTTKPEGEGTGLGLTICRDILREAGGDLRFEDGAEGACVLRARLPAAPSAPRGTRAPAAARGPRGLRILAVDDDPSFSRMLGRLLKEDGHRVRVVRDARSALRAFREGPWDAVLADWRLDGETTGLELHDRLPAPRPPFLFITGNVLDRGLVQALRRRGRVLFKPFEPSELRAALAALRPGPPRGRRSPSGAPGAAPRAGGAGRAKPRSGVPSPASGRRSSSGAPRTAGAARAGLRRR